VNGIIFCAHWTAYYAVYSHGKSAILARHAGVDNTSRFSRAPRVVTLLPDHDLQLDE